MSEIFLQPLAIILWLQKPTVMIYKIFAVHDSYLAEFDVITSYVCLILGSYQIPFLVVCFATMFVKDYPPRGEDLHGFFVINILLNV